MPSVSKVHSFEHIQFELAASVATLTLNRPQALNALTFDMMDDIRAALSEIESNREIGALIITGAGRGFCSGQDLRNRPGMGVDIVAALMDCYFSTMNAIRQCRVPVITAVNGVAAGGGCAMALLGDITLAAESAVFIQVFSRIGLVPDLGSTYLLPRLIGRARTLQMMLSNDPVSAATALEWGMINDCVEDAVLQPRARRLAEKLADQTRDDWRELRQQATGELQ
jgi:2-(1,2-epoxy-1,2-dihydrophenyl)acetyl-CoA isomerase